MHLLYFLACVSGVGDELQEACQNNSGGGGGEDAAISQ